MIVLFPILLIYMELVFHLYSFGHFGLGFIFAELFALSYGFFASALTNFQSKFANRIIGGVILTITAIAFSLQLVYHTIFKTYISIYSVLQNAGDATEFWREGLGGIFRSTLGLILIIIIPVAIYIFIIKRISFGFPYKPGKRGIFSQCFMLLAAIIVYAVTLLSLNLAGKDEHTAYDLYHDNFILDISMDKLGLITSVGLDIKNVFTETSTDELDLSAVTVALDPLNLKYNNDITNQAASEDSNTILSSDKKTSDNTTGELPAVNSTGSSSNISGEQDTSSENDVSTEDVTEPEIVISEPIDYKPNVLNIDFSQLAESSKDSSIKSLNDYFAASAPTMQNEYTGMFKDYNFIYLTCEGFSPWAVDKELTPTLYMLTHSGFVFNNFYNPIWYTSTSDGEYVACMGLLPYNTNSFKRSKNNALPFCFGHQFSRLGYTTIAYHDHSFTYYGRNETHPNMGYDFRAKNHGLNVTDQWPESDLEMMIDSIPQYINEDKFHVYYMTVSGHLEYNWSGNRMSSKNRDLVEGLPYSEHPKAYVACNIELDRALEYLINALRDAGKLDNTVIAFGADHYPYGLTEDEINELAGHEVEQNFELYRNHFVIWNSQITEPIIVDKYCSSLDMMPTLSNLFGLEYDSRLFMGSDIFSDAPSLVIFGNSSFITDYCKYNAATKEVTYLTDAELSESYVSDMIKVVRNKFAVSKNILLNDYYRTLNMLPD